MLIARRIMRFLRFIIVPRFIPCVVLAVSVDTQNRVWAEIPAPPGDTIGTSSNEEAGTSGIPARGWLSHASTAPIATTVPPAAKAAIARRLSVRARSLSGAGFGLHVLSVFCLQ